MKRCQEDEGGDRLLGDRLLHKADLQRVSAHAAEVPHDAAADGGAVVEIGAVRRDAGSQVEVEAQSVTAEGTGLLRAVVGDDPIAALSQKAVVRFGWDGSTQNQKKRKLLSFSRIVVL